MFVPGEVFIAMPMVASTPAALLRSLIMGRQLIASLKQACLDGFVRIFAFAETTQVGHPVARVKPT